SLCAHRRARCFGLRIACPLRNSILSRLTSTIGSSSTNTSSLIIFIPVILAETSSFIQKRLIFSDEFRAVCLARQQSSAKTPEISEKWKQRYHLSEGSDCAFEPLSARSLR